MTGVQTCALPIFRRGGGQDDLHARIVAADGLRAGEAVQPVFHHQLRKYRDEVLQGTLKFGRGWFYVVLQFFHASVLFAVAQFIYFAFIDKGYFMDTLSEMLLAPENKEALKALGMQGLEETLTMMRQMRPIDQVLNILMSNLLIGCLVGVPIAAFCKKEK